MGTPRRPAGGPRWWSQRDEVTGLGDIVVGSKPGRSSPADRVFVSPVGLAIEDVAAAYRIYMSARKLGMGVELELSKKPMWT